jgi:hypothetical protein
MDKRCIVEANQFVWPAKKIATFSAPIGFECATRDRFRAISHVEQVNVLKIVLSFPPGEATLQISPSVIPPIHAETIASWGEDTKVLELSGS